MAGGSVRGVGGVSNAIRGEGGDSMDGVSQVTTSESFSSVMCGGSCVGGGFGGASGIGILATDG